MSKTVKELRNETISQYNLHPGYSWVLAISFAVLSALIFFFAQYYLSVLFVTMIAGVLPLLFSTIISHRNLLHKKEPNVRKSIRFFFGFFSLRFNRVFSYWISLLKSLLIAIVAALIITIVSYYGLFSQSTTLLASLDELKTLTLTAEELIVEDYQTIFLANNAEVLKLFLIIILPTVAVFSLSMIYFISKNMMSSYIINEIPSMNPTYALMMYKTTLKKNRWYYFSRHFALNFPTYILYTIGYIVGVIVAFNYFDDSFIDTLNSYIFAQAFGLLFTAFYLPFSLNGQERIFESLDKEFGECSQQLTKEILSRVSARKNLSEEDKTKINNIINALENPEKAESLIKEQFDDQKPIEPLNEEDKKEENDEQS